MDVYVPSHRDRYGRRYGFVRFVKNGDPFELERRLQQIWIGTYKLRVRLSVSKHGTQQVINQTAIPRSNLPNGLVPDATYADVLAGRPKNANKQWRPKKLTLLDSREIHKEQWRGLTHEVSEEDMEWLKNCYAGQVHDPDAVFELKEKIFAEGLYSIKVTPMGGDLVLIQVDEGEDFLELVKDYEDIFEKWFCEL